MLLGNDFIVLLTDIETGSDLRMFLTVDMEGHLWEWGVCVEKQPTQEHLTYQQDFFKNLGFFHYFEECEI